MKRGECKAYIVTQNLVIGTLILVVADHDISRYKRQSANEKTTLIEY